MRQLVKAAAGFLAFVLFFGICSLKNNVGAVEVIPVWDLHFLGGQYFYEGDASALAGNISVDVTPAIKFSDKFTVIPTYTGSYQGTKSVEELAGGGTLFQDELTNGLLLKWTYKFAPALKMKSSLGYSKKLLRETKDEDYGDGLFDYNKINSGMEIEYAFPGRTGNEVTEARLGYDYFTLDFPNYQSLESDQASTLSRELVGEEVLNTKNHLVTFGGSVPVYKNVRGKLSGYWMRSDYEDQPIVNASGSLTDTNREDTLFSVSAAFWMPLISKASVKLIGEVGYGLSRLDSDQNHYDARKTFFTKDYYDYGQNTISTNFTCGFGKGKSPWLVSLGVARSKRDYKERVIQDPDGNYFLSGEKTYIKQTTASLGTSYPVTENFKLRMVSTLGWSNSNTQYEKVFKYHYKLANYLFGFSYTY